MSRKAVVHLLDVREMPDVIVTLNAILNNKGIAELKQEKNGITVVEIKRTLKTPKPQK
jgi:hypothetical protein